MKVEFLGVGSAWDFTNYSNSSLVQMHTEGYQPWRLLLDCGPSTPHQLFARGQKRNLDTIDGIFISHAHPDHYFGLPQLLGRMQAEDKREKSLIIFALEEVHTKIDELSKKFGYGHLWPFVERIKANPNVPESFKGGELSFALTKHGVPNLAIRISYKNKVMCYSGDGAITERYEALCRDANLVIQDTTYFNGTSDKHASIKEALAMAERSKVRHMALTHLEISLRRHVQNVKGKKKLFPEASCKVSVPKPGDIILV
jgi:ribonuclease Z